MEKFTGGLSVLTVFHLRLSSVGDFVDFEALHYIGVTLQIFFALNSLAELNLWLC